VLVLMMSEVTLSQTDRTAFIFCIVHQGHRVPSD